jgi:hypothetical protein
MNNEMFNDSSTLLLARFLYRATRSILAFVLPFAETLKSLAQRHLVQGSKQYRRSDGAHRF